MAYLQSAHAELSESIPFSLFEGDFLTRVFQRLGMGSYRTIDLVKRSLLLISITWVPLAILAVAAELHWIQPPGQNFFMDFAAYGQMLLSLPIFLIAERVIDRQTREASRCFITAGVVEAEDAARSVRINQRLKQLRHSIWPDLGCIALGYVLTASWMVPEMLNDRDTWHAMGPIFHLPPSTCDNLGNCIQEPSAPLTWSMWLQVIALGPFTTYEVFRESPQPLTWPGLYEFLIAGPLTTYWWLRWVVKIGFWIWYLYQISNLRLNLVASHPDKTGGIGFLSDAQTKFGLVILAFGVSFVAPTLLYKLKFEGATIAVWAVWGSAAGFVVGAPFFFTSPLFMFTRQLYHAKTHALEILQERSMERAKAFEEKWLNACSSGKYEVMSGNDLSGLDALNRVYDHIHKMRVVPLDLRSFSELVWSALGPMIPLLPYVIDLPEPVLKAIEKLVR
ncbi:MAG: hypothetical protein KF747_06290 [Nitrospira sp.]|nr:hypothetical protein [Nitrospira sp.]